MPWKLFNNNPTGRRGIGDCSVRAVSVALDISWEQAYLLIAAAGFSQGDVISSNAVWGTVLRQNGFTRYSLPAACPDCYTFGDFAKDHPKGVYVLCTGTHVATVRDSIILDAWDSSAEVIQFYWTKEAE